MAPTKQLNPRIVELLKRRTAGQLEPGNIDLAQRPIAYNPDGSYSTVRTMGFQDGKVQRNIPTVTADGRVVGPDEAIREYRRTGQHLGAFSSPEAAEKAARSLHEDQASDYDARAAANEPTTGPTDPGLNFAQQAARKYAAITPRGAAHSEEFNRGMPGGGAVADPYGNALIDGVAGGIAGALRPGASAAVRALEPTGAKWAGSVPREDLVRLSHREILERLGVGRANAAELAGRAPLMDAEMGARQVAGAPHEIPNAESWASQETHPSELSLPFYENEARLAEMRAAPKAAPGRVPTSDVKTGVLKAPKAPKGPTQGTAPITGVNKPPYAPGEAPRADGLSPQDVVRAQMEKLNSYKAPEKLAKGGVVHEGQNAADDHPARPGIMRAGVPKGTLLLSKKAELARLEKEAAGNPEVHLSPAERNASFNRFDKDTRPDYMTEAEYKEALRQENNFAKERPALAEDGFARGGIVKPHHVYSACADALHTKYFAVGGTVDQPMREPSDANDEQTPVLSQPAAATSNPFAGLESQLGPVAAPPAAPAPVPAPGPAHASPPAPAPIPDPKVAVGHDALKTDDDPLAELKKIESDRAAALENSKPGFGRMVARVIGSGLLAFGGQKPVDFEAGDRANRAEINAEADKKRQNFLTTPAELAVRNSALSGSNESTNLRGLVGKLLGDTSLTQNMSAQELKAAGPFVQEYIQAKRAGDTLKQQAAIAGLKISVDKAKLANDELRVGLEGRKTAVAEKQLGINQQNADSNRIRAEKAGSQHDDQTVQQYLTAKESTRSAPDLAQAKKDELALSKIDLLLQKTHPSANDIDVLAGELAKVASGSAGNVHLEEKLSAPTLAGRYAKIKQYLTGEPGSAGYEEVIKKVFAPYVKDLHKAVEAAKIKHYHTAFKNYESRLPPEFAAEERHKLGLDSAEPVPEENKDPDADLGPVE